MNTPFVRPSLSYFGRRRPVWPAALLLFGLGLSTGALRATTVATDASVPNLMNAGGTSGNPAGYIVGNTGAVTLDFGSSTDVYVGNNQPYNALTVQSGSTLKGLYGSIGVTSANNSATVTGAGSIWTTAQLLAVGDGGAFNSLLVTNGGEVSSKLGHVGSGENGDNNSATISGSGSKWTNTNGLIVGSSGAGNSLTINQAGRVSNTTGTIGNAIGANGNTVTVTGTNSTWANSTGLTVGSQGQSNVLTVTSGGSVTSTTGTIGKSAEGTGNSATVSGSSASWIMSGELRVGDGGHASTLNVATGGLVSSAGATIGYAFEAADNLVQVSGGGSTLRTTSSLTIGRLATATNNILQVTNLGLVSISTTLTFGTNTSNVIQLDGFLAWKGNHVSDLQTLITSGRIQGFVDGSWGTVSTSAFEIAYFADDATASAFTGGLHGGLGTYTIVRSVGAIPEPGATAAFFGAIALGGGWWWRRRKGSSGVAAAL